MSARENILAKLRQAKRTPLPEPQTQAYYHEMTPQWENDVARLKHWAAAMRAVKTEIYWVSAQNWTSTLCQVAQEKGLRNILLPLKTEHGKQAAQALQEQGTVEIKTFEQEIEHW